MNEAYQALQATQKAQAVEALEQNVQMIGDAIAHSHLRDAMLARISVLTSAEASKYKYGSNWLLANAQILGEMALTARLSDMPTNDSNFADLVELSGVTQHCPVAIDRVYKYNRAHVLGQLDDKEQYKEVSVYAFSPLLMEMFNTVAGHTTGDAPWTERMFILSDTHKVLPHGYLRGIDLEDVAEITLREAVADLSIPENVAAKFEELIEKANAKKEEPAEMTYPDIPTTEEK